MKSNERDILPTHKLFSVLKRSSVYQNSYGSVLFDGIISGTTMYGLELGMKTANIYGKSEKGVYHITWSKLRTSQ